jgi:GTP-binding protein
VSYQVVLTKVDKISKTDLEKVAERTQTALAKHPAAFPKIILTSSEKTFGFEELRGTIAQLIEAHGA